MSSEQFYQGKDKRQIVAKEYLSPLYIQTTKYFYQLPFLIFSIGFIHLYYTHSWQLSLTEEHLSLLRKRVKEDCLHVEVRSKSRLYQPLSTGYPSKLPRQEEKFRERKSVVTHLLSLICTRNESFKYLGRLLFFMFNMCMCMCMSMIMFMLSVFLSCVCATVQILWLGF